MTYMRAVRDDIEEKLGPVRTDTHLVYYIR
jgi:hypothetical protein